MHATLFSVKRISEFQLYLSDRELTANNLVIVSDYLQKHPPEVFYKKAVLRNFTKFIGKDLCQSLFFNKVAGLQLYLKRDSGTGVFL